MKGRRVAIPSVSSLWVTKGKRYEVIEERHFGFDIISDDGHRINCLKEQNECAFLNEDGSWKLLTERK